jgi:hypothetical protein
MAFEYQQRRTGTEAPCNEQVLQPSAEYRRVPETRVIWTLVRRERIPL